MDLSLANLERLPALDESIEVLGKPVLAGLYGPFESPEDAEVYRSLVEEPGTELVLSQVPGRGVRTARPHRR